MRFVKILAVAGFLIAGVVAPSLAQDWPTRPVRLVVSFPPGAGADLLARKLSDKLGILWKQPIVVDNKAGAGEVIAATTVVRAAPDGYTLLLGTDASLQTNQFLFAKLPYLPERDFTPITRLFGGPLVYVVKADSPIQSIEQLVDTAKAKPGSLSYGTAGVGSAPHLAVHWFAKKAGDVQFLNVPYQGAAPRLQALLAGQIDFTAVPYPGVVEYLKTHRMRALAVTSERRMKQLPDVPTILEKGFKDTVYNNLFALVGPAKMPPDIVARIARDAAAVLKDPEFKANVLDQNGLDAIGDSPSEFAQFLANDFAAQRDRVKAINVTLD